MPNTLDLNKKNTGDAISTKINKIEVYYGNKDEKKAVVVDTSTIVELKLTENIFNTLPTLKLKIMDTGLWWNTCVFQVGGIIKLKIFSTIKEEIQNYLNCDFIIQGINYYTKQEQSKYIYELNCIAGAEKYINDVCSYPEESLLDKIYPAKHNSKEVLINVMNRAGVKFISLLENNPKDKMDWVCGGITYAEFAKKIIEHAWISDDDIPMLYFDKNAICYYTTLKTMCKNGSKYKYYFDTVFQKMVQSKPEEENTIMATMLTYRDIMIFNSGYLLNDGGYKVNIYQYNPYNNKKIDKKEQEIKKIEDEEKPFYRKSTFENKEVLLATVSNKSNNSRENITYAERGGIFFQEMHEHYNIAPLHHKNFRNSFFTNFVYINIDTTKQNGNVNGSDVYPKLGEVIYIDTSDTKYGNQLQSGKFLVTGLTHLWVPNRSYTIAIQCVNDGIGGVGQSNELVDDVKDKKK